jgi:hypothetical protein
MLGPWLEGERCLDADKARELALEIERRGVDRSGMSESLERVVLGVIERARKALVRP